MNRKIVQAMIAAVTATHMLGNVATAGAYSGTTGYPENQTTGLVVTMIDVRNNKLDAHLRFANNHAAILKGVMFFEGDVEDSELLSAYPGDDYAMKQYGRADYHLDGWEDKESSEELTVQLDENLEENTSHMLGFTYFYWANADNHSTNINWGRVNYERCATSEVFLNTEDAICRAEVWDDAVVHYQPYVGWNRLKMEDETEDKEVIVFKDSLWTELPRENTGGSDSEGSEGGENGSEGTGSEGGSEGEGSGGETGSEGENGGGEETKIIYVDREVPVEVIVEKEVIVEVPVEKEVIVPVEKEVVKEVIKEVPVETTVVKEVVKEVPVEKKIVETVEVQVPVEKTVVDVREIVKEVPVETVAVSEASTSNAALWANMVAANALGEIEDAASGEMDETGDSGPNDGQDEEDDETVDDGIEPKTSGEQKPEVVDVPQLGKEETKSSDFIGRIATFIAGLISAAAILMIVVMFRRRKQSENNVE